MRFCALVGVVAYCIHLVIKKIKTNFTNNLCIRNPGIFPKKLDKSNGTMMCIVHGKDGTRI